MSCEIRIGTSGWHYNHWRGPFYPESFPAAKMLESYAERFDTVEINNSFYRLPDKKTFESWAEESPRGFRFAVKASRFITHMKKLKDPDQPINKVLSHAQGLGSKLGPVLFQLPPKWTFNKERFEDFLDALPTGHRYAFEFREPSWHNDEVYKLLKKRRAAFCIYQLAGFASPITLTTSFAYVRLHGPGKKAYTGNYTHNTLKKWAERIKGWKKNLSAVYVYFDNDQNGYAALDALKLKEMVE